jgi:hypothetical protein
LDSLNQQRNVTSSHCLLGTNLNLTFFILDEIAHSKNPLASWMITLPDLIASSAAYFNQTSVTLHPVVVYHKGAEGDLLHRSFIIVSDEMAHKAGTVITFVKEFITVC